MQPIAVATDIAASPRRVWDVLTDFARYPDWSVYIRRIDGQVKAGSRIRVVIGPPNRPPYYDVRTTVIEATPGVRLAWAAVMPGAAWLPTFLFGGTHELTLVALPGGGTRLLHRERFVGLLARLTDKGPRGGTEGFVDFNTALKYRVETLVAGDSADRPA